MNSSNNLKILVCEDDKTVAELHRMHLSRLLKSPAVEIVANGNQGKSNLLFNRYDLILSDLNMPGLNGLELFRFARLAGFHMPFILCTSLSSDFLQTQKNDDFYFLRKPYSIKDLQNALTTLLA